MGSVETAEVLLARGADVDPTDFRGQSPLHFAALHCDAPCVSLLLRSKADANRRGPDGGSPLELLPKEHEDYHKVAHVLKVYERPVPQPFRCDARFDISDPRDVL